jgi:serine phosphatase RsbU (regulator of sigma subunit)
MRPITGRAGFTASLWPTRTLVIAELEGDGTVVAANEVAQSLAGEPLVGRPFADLIAPGQRRALDSLLRAAADAWTGMTAGLAPGDDGVPVDFELWARRDDDRVLIVAEPHVRGTAALNTELLRLNDELISARRDAAKSADAERGARQKAEASALQLRNLQQIVDTTLAELSLDDLLGEILSRICESIGADAVEALLIDEMENRLIVRADRGLPPRAAGDAAFPLDGGLPGETLRAGRPLQVRPVNPESGVSRALVETARSLIAVPLQAERRPLGVLLLGTAQDRAFSPADVEILELAAHRVAGAIERVLAFERERSVASVLQDNLMPGAIPELPGLDVAARYRPAGIGHRVGGDFYDIFELPGRRTAIIVGDVRGKGPEAAARTALIRFTVRALAPREDSPAALLGDLNQAMLDQSAARRRHCTIVYAALEHGDDGIVVELSSGGHPPALIVRSDGSVHPVSVPGSLVGLLEEVAHRNAAERLDKGDTLVFYTDGVTEARRDGELYGEDRLATLLAENLGDEPQYVADAIERSVEEFSDGPLRDDLAIVVVKAV